MHIYYIGFITISIESYYDIEEWVAIKIEIY